MKSGIEMSQFIKILRPVLHRIQIIFANKYRNGCRTIFTNGTASNEFYLITRTFKKNLSIFRVNCNKHYLLFVHSGSAHGKSFYNY